jgi:hypothetical protein
VIAGSTPPFRQSGKVLEYQQPPGALLDSGMAAVVEENNCTRLVFLAANIWGIR